MTADDAPHNVTHRNHRPHMLGRDALMRRAERAFYRSRLVRVAFLLSGGFVAYTLSPLAPLQWHETPSLLLIHRILPWWAMSAPFVVYTLLLLWGTVETSIIAEALGMVLYTVQLAALIVAATTRQAILIEGVVHQQHVWSPLAMAAFALVVVMHYAALRLAVIDSARSSAGLR